MSSLNRRTDATRCRKARHFYSSADFEFKCLMTKSLFLCIPDDLPEAGVLKKFSLAGKLKADSTEPDEIPGASPLSLAERG